MTIKKREELVAMLRDKQSVCVDGLYIKAVRLDICYHGIRCDCCDMDCLCKGNIGDICDSLNAGAINPYILKLCHS